MFSIELLIILNKAKPSKRIFSKLLHPFNYMFLEQFLGLK